MGRSVPRLQTSLVRHHLIHLVQKFHRRCRSSLFALLCRRLLDQIGKHAGGIGQQILGRIEFGNAAIVQHHDTIVIDDGVESVGNREHGAILKGRTNRRLNDGIGGVVHIGRRFVQNQHLRSSQQCTCHTEQLTLSNAQVLPTLGHFSV